MADDNQTPVFQIQRIYLKDLSLEQPNSPQILLEQGQPAGEINLTLGADPIADGMFEVTVMATVTTKVNDKTLFLVEAKQGGIFEIRNIPEEQLRQILDSGQNDPKEIFLDLSSHDIAAACDLLRPVWDGGEGLDGYVSWEVDPTLAYDRDATVAEARRLHEWIERPNLYVKIPATEPGLGAIEEMIASGRNINVTLIFSLERHKAVMEAYIRGLERLVESGGDPAAVHSVASFFVSRVDTETDRRLDAIGGEAAQLKGKLGIANAKVAYQHYLETFAGPRWDALECIAANLRYKLLLDGGVRVRKKPSWRRSKRKTRYGHAPWPKIQYD